jgi:hypothetical protein
MSVLNTISSIANRNAPTILTVVGTIGVFATAVLTGKATLEAAEKVRHVEKTVERRLTNVEIIEVSWRYFIPPAMLAIGTTAAIIGMHSIHAKRATALLSAYSITDTAFREYQHKVTDILGDKKERTLREEIAADQIRKNPPPENREVIIIGNGTVMCLEISTGRYFWSDYESIRKAENTINAQLIHEMSASQNEFYSLIGIPQTSIGDMLGWNVDHLMEITYGCELDPDHKPCLAIDYRVAPRTDYYKLH